MRYQIFLFLFLLNACVSIKAPDSFSYKEVQTPFFKIATWQKLSTSNAPVKVYIEGDGNAFNRYGQPTSDPTPKGVFVRKMAFEDPSDNVIYMARPCQFLKDNKCQQKYWTTARFSNEVIQSQAYALKKLVGNRPVALIGFSGGAQVGGLIAVLHPQIKTTNIINYAPNLDHKNWTYEMGLEPLKDSLYLGDYKKSFLSIPQINYIPEDDEIIAPHLSIIFLNYDATKFEIIKNKGHNFK